MDETFSVDPERDWARLAVNPGGRTTSVEWRFWIDGEPITIETGQDVERDELARTLAAALGWDLPEPGELPRAA